MAILLQICIKICKYNDGEKKKRYRIDAARIIFKLEISISDIFYEIHKNYFQHFSAEIFRHGDRSGNINWIKT